MQGANYLDPKFWDFKKLEEDQVKFQKQAAMNNPLLKQFLTGQGALALDGGEEIEGGYYEKWITAKVAELKAKKDS